MRTPIAVVVSSLLGCLVGAPSAQASTSVVLEPYLVWLGVPIPANYAYLGSEIILQTVVTADGGETASSVQGVINYQDAWVNPSPASNYQISLSTVGTAAPYWLTGVMTCTSTGCVALNQIHCGDPSCQNAFVPAQAGVTHLAISQVRFLVDPITPIGTVLQFTWRTTPTTAGLDWYGVTNAPGVSITVIPEPATAALLGVGLAGLALASRRDASLHR